MTPEEDLFQKLRGAEAVKPTAPTNGSGVEKEILRGDPGAGAPVTLRNLFTHHDTHPVVIDFALLKMFGPEWVNWEPETIWQEVQRSFKNQISEHARAKVQTVKTLHASDLPWQKWQVFEKIVQGLNNNIPHWEVMQAPSIEQLYVAIDIMSEIRQLDFNEEVRRYIAAAALHDEVCFLPMPLAFAQADLSHLELVCGDCGNREDFHGDHTCSVCSKRFSPEQGMSFEPALVDRGKNTTVEMRYDPAPVKARWDAVATEPLEKVSLEESTTDVQVGKLLIARDYLNVRRKQLAEQLTSLKSWLGSA